MCVSVCVSECVCKCVCVFRQHQRETNLQLPLTSKRVMRGERRRGREGKWRIKREEERVEGEHGGEEGGMEG